MPILARSAVPTALRAVAQLWTSFGVSWTGGDGQRFDLVDPDGGIVVTRDGILGLNMPKFDRYTTTAPGLAGSSWRGARTQERAVSWPIFVYGGSTDEWIERDRAFWASLRPDVPGTWTVTAPNGTARSLQCRLVDDGSTPFGADPAQAGWSVYVVNLVADDQPYWYGEDIERTFGVPDPSAFFMPSGGVFSISSGQTTDNAKISNPGDVQAWPIWTVGGAGGLTDATLGAGGGAVVLPTLADGEVWTIDTRPDQMTATDQDGVDHSDEVEWNPAPVPAGSSVELSIAMTSPGSGVTVSCRITPLYFRAF